MLYKCEFTQLTAQPALTMRTRAAAEDLSQMFGKGYAEIMRYLTEIEAQPAGSPFALYYNMDRRDLDMELGIPLLTDLPGKGSIISNHAPEGKAFGCLHTGPYDEVEPVYYALGQWIKDNGYEASGVAYEVYLNDPEHTLPEKRESHIYLLIRTVEL